MLENSLEKKRINGLLHGHFVVTDHSAAVRKREARDAAANCGVLGGKYTKNDKGGYASHWSPHRMEEPEKCKLEVSLFSLEEMPLQFFILHNLFRNYIHR